MFSQAINDGYVDLVADMADVEFIDVVGLETLAGVANEVRDVGGTLAAAGRPTNWHAESAS